MYNIILYVDIYVQYGTSMCLICFSCGLCSFTRCAVCCEQCESLLRCIQHKPKESHSEEKLQCGEHIGV